ncbi:hypothetical protein D5Z43_20500 [Escherichia coli]|nr:hypothetical protein [Escherichia coli]MFB02246.1 hypothetical protein [Escherichia coli]HBM8236024.1 hypothetical protein [Escherichia coli]
MRLFTDAILNILSKNKKQKTKNKKQKTKNKKQKTKNKKYLKIKHKNKIPPDQEAGGEFVD